MSKNPLSSLHLPITFAALALTSFGILMIFSVDPNLAYQQLIFAVLGFLVFIIVSNFDYRVLANFSIYLFLVSVFLLLLLVFWGIEVKGAVRWIDFGIYRFQPSELIKPFLIIILAVFLSRKDVMKFANFLLSFLICALLAFLVFKQPDLGNAIVYLTIWVGMVIASGSHLAYLSALFSGGLIMIPVAWRFLAEYQKDRILTFIYPMADPLGTGYNVAQSTIAVGSGQLFGRGFGHGTQSHLQFLPAQTTDFIFATFAEELGFFGALILIAIFIFLIFHLFKIAKNASDLQGSLIVIGVASLISFQTIVNIGMNVGLVPVVGITLPLFSLGGSSLISTFFALGLVVSVLKFSPKTLT